MTPVVDAPERQRHEIVRHGMVPTWEKNRPDVSMLTAPMGTCEDACRVAGREQGPAQPHGPGVGHLPPKGDQSRSLPRRALPPCGARARPPGEGVAGPNASGAPTRPARPGGSHRNEHMFEPCGMMDGVAGGMNKRGGWGPMTDRVKPAAETAEGLPPPPRTLKHCWVTDRHGRLPGLLLEWRLTESGYRGRVVHPVYEDGWVVVEEWLPAELLERA